MRVEKIGRATLYCGDSTAILPTLGQFEGCVTDPPYGINATKFGGGRNGENGWAFYEDSEWDKVRPEREIFDIMRARSKHQIIWGGNYFTDYLPPTMQWLIWDKGQRDFSLADCEVAWSSQQKAMRIFDYARAKALQDGKQHPTQKPVELMKWCLDFINGGGGRGV